MGPVQDHYQHVSTRNGISQHDLPAPDHDAGITADAALHSARPLAREAGRRRSAIDGIARPRRQNHSEWNASHIRSEELRRTNAAFIGGHVDGSTVAWNDQVQAVGFALPALAR